MEKLLLLPSQKCLLIFATLMGFCSVAAGAFGAHALKQKLSQDLLAVFEVAARYQMYHALAIVFAVWLTTIQSSFLAEVGGWLFLAGTLLFSGSLYLLALTEIRILGAITPVGGVLLLIGWLSLAIAIYRS